MVLRIPFAKAKIRMMQQSNPLFEKLVEGTIITSGIAHFRVKMLPLLEVMEMMQLSSEVFVKKLCLVDRDQLEIV